MPSISSQPAADVGHQASGQRERASRDGLGRSGQRLDDDMTDNNSDTAPKEESWPRCSLTAGVKSEDRTEQQVATIGKEKSKLHASRFPPRGDPPGGGLAEA